MKNTLGMCQKLSEWIITFAGANKNIYQDYNINELHKK